MKIHKNPKLFEFDNTENIVDIFIWEDQTCPYPFNKDGWFHQGFHKEEFLRIVDEFLQKNGWGCIQFD